MTVLLAASSLLVVTSVTLGAFCYGPLFWPRGSDAHLDRLSEILRSDLWHELGQLFRTELPWSVGILLVGLAAGVLAARWQRLATVLLLVLFTVDLGRHCRAEYPTIEPRFHDEPGSTRFLKEHADPPRVDLYRAPTEIAAPGYLCTMRPYREIGECLYWERGPLLMFPQSR